MTNVASAVASRCGDFGHSNGLAQQQRPGGRSYHLRLTSRDPPAGQISGCVSGAGPGRRPASSQVTALGTKRTKIVRVFELLPLPSEPRRRRQAGRFAARGPIMARERNANAALSWPSRPAPATRGCRWRPRSGVGVRAGVTAADAEVEAVEVELPPFTVVIALPVIGQAVVAKYQAGAAAFG